MVGDGEKAALREVLAGAGMEEPEERVVSQVLLCRGSCWNTSTLRLLCSPRRASALMSVSLNSIGCIDRRSVGAKLTRVRPVGASLETGSDLLF